MAYTDTRQDTHRVAKGIAVAAVQAAVAYGLVMGLYVEITQRERTALEAENYPNTMPLPEEIKLPPEEKPEIAKDRPPPAPQPRPDADYGFISKSPITNLPVAGPVPGTGTGNLIEDIKPVTQFIPVGAKPRNDPAGWVVTSDYPARDLREGNEGATRFQLDIDAGGKVTDCKVTGSSGHSGLDEATCRNISKRARFDPAKGDGGEPIAGTYSSTVRWVIPKD